MRLTLCSRTTYNSFMRKLVSVSIAVIVLSVAAMLVKAQQPASQPPGQSAPASPATPPSQQQPGAAPQQAPPLKVTTGLVHLVAAVTDRRNKFITDLDQKDFRILEDGKPEDIRFFGRQTDLPLRI